MKKVVALFAAVLCVLFLAPTAFADNTVELVDSERSAQALANVNVDRYECQFGFNRYLEGKYQRNVAGSCTMDSKGQFTYVMVDGKVVVNVKNGDKLSPALEVNDTGETRDFYFFVTGFEGPAAKVNGDFQANLLAPDAPIRVQLKPLWVQKFVPYSPTDGTSPANLLLVITTTSGQYSVAYDQWYKGFPVWVDPLVATPYHIVDAPSGTVLAGGDIDPLRGDEAGNGSFVTFSLPGEVVRVEFGQNDYVSYDRLQLNGSVERCPELGVKCKEGQRVSVSAKVFTLNMNSKALNLSAYVYDGGSVGFEVRMWQEIGEMPVIATTTPSAAPYLYVGTGYKHVVVSVTGKTGPNGFYVGFSRY